MKELKQIYSSDNYKNGIKAFNFFCIIRVIIFLVFIKPVIDRYPTVSVIAIFDPLFSILVRLTVCVQS